MLLICCKWFTQNLNSTLSHIHSFVKCYYLPLIVVLSIFKMNGERTAFFSRDSLFSDLSFNSDIQHILFLNIKGPLMESVIIFRSQCFSQNCGSSPVKSDSHKSKQSISHTMIFIPCWLGKVEVWNSASILAVVCYEVHEVVTKFHFF